MTDTKKQTLKQPSAQKQPTEKRPTENDVPAHATEAEKQRLKDFNKDGIPPGSC